MATAINEVCENRTVYDPFVYKFHLDDFVGVDNNRAISNKVFKVSGYVFLKDESENRMIGHKSNYVFHKMKETTVYTRSTPPVTDVDIKDYIKMAFKFRNDLIKDGVSFKSSDIYQLAHFYETTNPEFAFEAQ